MTRFLRVLYHLCRLSLGALFLYAGWVKSQDIIGFAGQVAAYQILPYQGNFLVAATLPYVEIMCAVLLLLNKRVRPAALLLGFLTLAFMIVLSSVIVRGLAIDCGCFGPHDSARPETALVRDFAILLLAHFTFHLRNRFTRKSEA